MFIELILIALSLLCSECALRSAPLWTSNEYFKADSHVVVSSMINDTIRPTYTFTYSSSFSALPQLAYAIKSY